MVLRNLSGIQPSSARITFLKFCKSGMVHQGITAEYYALISVCIITNLHKVFTLWPKNKMEERVKSAYLLPTSINLVWPFRQEIAIFAHLS